MSKTGVAMQFADAHQQHKAATLGMWAFLTTEVLFFGPLFLLFAVYLHTHPHGFAEGSSHLLKELAALNTAVLLTSSYTMALASHAASTNRRIRLRALLAATALLGVLFLCIKAFEYGVDAREDLIPGLDFRAGLSQQTMLFFVFYFVLTALHALHVAGGIAAIALTFCQVGPKSERSLATRVELLGLYWHFVDMVWLILFPLLYLVPR